MSRDDAAAIFRRWWWVMALIALLIGSLTLNDPWQQCGVSDAKISA